MALIATNIPLFLFGAAVIVNHYQYFVPKQNTCQDIRKEYCYDSTIMSSNPGHCKLGVHSIFVEVVLEQKI